jgi:hypothetical protein
MGPYSGKAYMALGLLPYTLNCGNVTKWVLLTSITKQSLREFF